MKTTPGARAEADASAQFPASDPRIVVLVGFMGAGKTSVGRILGQQLGWSFEDLDDRIQAREERTIEQIFRESGEAEFRRAEHSALRELLGQPTPVARILALGGGAFVQAGNAALIKESGATVIFLDAPLEELFRRCEQESRERPLRQDRERFRQLYEARRPHYAAAAMRIDTGGKGVEGVAAEIAARLKLQ
jgi:shikimate kinase